MAYSKEQLYSALEKADASGNTADAKEIAGMIKGMGEDFDYNSVLREDGWIVFDKATEIPSYQKSLKKMYGEEMPDASIKELQERNHEYINSMDLNSVSGIDTLKDVLTNFDEEQLRSFETNLAVADKTATLGEGSRSGLEQAKDFGNILVDPLTWASFGIGKAVGGKAVQMGTREAIKQGIRYKLKQFAKSNMAKYGAIASAEASVLDATRQGIEIGASSDGQEWSNTRAALTAGIGAVAPVVITKGLGVAGKALAKPIEFAAQGVNRVGRGLVKAMGGGTAAREGVIDKAKKEIFGDQSEYVEGIANLEKSALKHSEDVSVGVKNAGKEFTKRYDDLGEIDVSAKTVEKLVDDLHGQAGVAKIGNLESIVKLMKGLKLTPTQALRKVRSTLGSEANKAKRGVGNNISADQVLRASYKESRKQFKIAAGKAGKGKQASKLDKDYSEFIKIKGDKTIAKLIEDPQYATAKLKQVLSGNDPLKIDSFMKQMDSLGKLSKNEDFSKNQKTYLRNAMAEQLFKGQNAANLKSVLSTNNGRKVLERLFKDKIDKDLWRTFAQVLEKAGKGNMTGTLVTRLLSTGAGFATTGPVGGMVGYALADSILKSPLFTKLAYNIYANNPKARGAAVRKLAEKFKVKPDTIYSILGIPVVGGLAAYDYSTDGGIRDGLMDAYKDIAQYFED